MFECFTERSSGSLCETHGYITYLQGPKIDWTTTISSLMITQSYIFYLIIFFDIVIGLVILSTRFLFPSFRNMALCELDIAFLQTNQICKDVKGHILSYIPFEYKDAMIDVFGDKIFVNQHIHHYEPHYELMVEYDRKTKAKYLECGMVNGQRHGEYMVYFPDGKLRSLIKCRNGKKEGEALEYFEDGQVLARGKFKDDKPHGNFTSFFPDGRTFAYSKYINGLKNGVERNWHYTGGRKDVAHYVNGKRHGIYKEWNHNGSKSEVSHYLDGKLHGVHQVYGYDGKILNEDIYNNGSLTKSTDWYLNGNMESEVEYKDRKMFGHYKRWYKDGKIREIGIYGKDEQKIEYTKFKDDEIIFQKKQTRRGIVYKVCNDNIVRDVVCDDPNMLNLPYIKWKHNWVMFNRDLRPFGEVDIRWEGKDDLYMKHLYRAGTIKGYNITYRKDNPSRKLCMFYSPRARK